MNDTLTLALIMALTLATLGGLLLGVFFFGGLWWTLRRGLTSPQPALWFMGSLLLRMAVVVTGFYWVGGGDWRRLLACLFGFLIARIAVTWLTRSPVITPSVAASAITPPREDRHASQP